MSSEDIDSSTHPESNSRGEEEPFPQPPPVVVPPIRIRVVSEINSPEVADTLCQFAQKRSWLASHSEAEDSTKKPKVEANSDQDTTNCELPLSNMDPGTSAGSSSPKTNATSNGQEIDKSAVAGSSAELVGGQGPVVVKQEVTIKEEPADETPSGSNDPPPTVAVAQPVNIKKESSIKEEATSSIRDSCQFGIRCYRDEDKNSPETSKRPWTTRDVKRMLRMVKDRPVLWQVEHSDYKHRHNRPLALLEIEKVIGFTSLEIKRKLHNMRCTFRNQFKMKNNQNPNRTITWKYYNAMKFMYASALSNVDDGDDVSWNEPDEDENDCDEKLPPVLLSPKTHLPLPSTPIESQISIPLPSLSPQKSSSLPSKCKSKVEEKSLPEVGAIEKDDDCNEFGDYVADSIRNLPTDLKDLAKKQISHLLIDMIAHSNERELNANFDELESNVLCPATATPVFGICQRTSPIETQEFQLKLHEF